MLKLKSKVGPKGQVVIPKPIRDMQKILTGQEVYFTVENGEIVIKKADYREILEMFRSGKKVKAPKHIDWDAEYYSQFE